MKQTITQNTQTSLLRLSLINNLKQKIETLNKQVEKQQLIIENYKRSTKTTLINQQQIQIQKLNDQNKRLLLIIQEFKAKHNRNNWGRFGKSGISRMSSMNVYSSTKKKDHIDELQQNPDQPQTLLPKQKKPLPTTLYQTKYYQLLLQTQKLRKQLIILKANETTLKNKKPLNQRSSILMENNINQIDKAELNCKQECNKKLKNRVQELEDLLEQALQIEKSMRFI